MGDSSDRVEPARDATPAEPAIVVEEHGRAPATPLAVQPAAANTSPTPRARTIKESTTIELRLALTLIVLGASAGAAVGGLGVSWNQTSKQTELAAAHERILKMDKTFGKYAETVIANVDMPDSAVKEWVGIFGNVLDNTTAAQVFNTRALRIYQHEEKEGSKRSESGVVEKREFRRVELRRSIRWADAAIEKDPEYHWPHWNKACVSALLGDTEEALDQLLKLQPLIPPSNRDQMRKKFCTDDDLCPIQSEAGFAAFIAKQRCAASETRKCLPTTIR